jgi:hypothetical protein
MRSGTSSASLQHFILVSRRIVRLPSMGEQCPVCFMTFVVSPAELTAHVNACLDLPPDPRSPSMYFGGGVAQKKPAAKPAAAAPGRTAEAAMMRVLMQLNPSVWTSAPSVAHLHRIELSSM